MNAPPSSDNKRKFSTLILSDVKFSGLQSMGSGSSWFGSSDSASYNENSTGLDTEASSSRAVFDPEHGTETKPSEQNFADEFEPLDFGSSMLQLLGENNFASPSGDLTPAIWNTCVANPFQNPGQGETSTPSCSWRKMPLWSETSNQETGLPEPLGDGPGGLGLDLGFENHHKGLHVHRISGLGPQPQEDEYCHHRAGINWNWVAGGIDMNRLGDEDVYKCTPSWNVVPEVPALQPNPEGFVDPSLRIEDGSGTPSTDWPEHRMRVENTLLFWKKAQFRAQIIGHPLFGAILRSHINCIHLMTPAHKMGELALQMNNVSETYQSYVALAPSKGYFRSMVPPQQLDLLLSKVLAEVRGYEAALRRNSKLQAAPSFNHLYSVSVLLRQLTGKNVSPPDDVESGPTMSDDDQDDDEEDDVLVEEVADEEQQELLDDDTDDGFRFSQADRTLLWNIRGHLISTLGLDKYRGRIREVRNEIMRKGRASKLPRGSIDVLRRWWDHHTGWPYPTEEEKQQFTELTGLGLKQVNNWFINQRKRNWVRLPTTRANAKHTQRNNI